MQAGLDTLHPSPLLKQSRRDGPSTSPKVWIGVAAGGPAQSRRDPAQSRRDPAQSRRQSAAQKTAKPTQNLRKPQSTLPFLPNTRQTPGRHSSRPKVALRASSCAFPLFPQLLSLSCLSLFLTAPILYLLALCLCLFGLLFSHTKKLLVTSYGCHSVVASIMQPAEIAKVVPQ